MKNNNEELNIDQNAPADHTTDGEVKTVDNAEDNQGIDYKAELEKVQKERDNYKQGMLKYKKDLKELKSADDEEDDLPGGELDTVLEKKIEQKVAKRIDEKITTYQMALKRDEIEKQLSQVATDEDEKELIRYHLENSIVSTGKIDEDVRRAKVLANGSVIMNQNREMADALSSRTTSNSSPNFNGQKLPRKKNPLDELKPFERELLKKYGAEERYIKQHS